MWKKTILSLWTLSVCYVIYVSVIPSPEVPLEFDFADKVYHTLAYLWLGFLPAIGFDSRKNAGRAAMFAILLGVAMEIVQSFLPTRSCELGDVLADTIGSISGLYLGLFAKNRMVVFRNIRERND